MRVAAAAGLPVVGGVPVGTLSVNLVGAAALGYLLPRLLASGRTRTASLVCTGLLGALTTFSTFAVELVELLRSRPLTAIAYAAVSMVGGLAAARLGRWAAQS